MVNSAYKILVEIFKTFLRLVVEQLYHIMKKVDYFFQVII